MMVLIIYDITDDRLRTKVADTLLAYGLTRVQKSAFLGPLTKERLKDLKVKLNRMIQGQRANIQFYPLCPNCYIRRREIGVPTVPKYPIEQEAIIIV